MLLLLVCVYDVGLDVWMMMILMVILCVIVCVWDGLKLCVVVCGDGCVVNFSCVCEIVRWIFIEFIGGFCIYNVYVYVWWMVLIMLDFYFFGLFDVVDVFCE